MDIFPFQNPDFRRFSEALEKLYTPVEMKEFPELFFQIIDDLVPGTFSTLNDIDLKSGRQVDYLSRSVPDEETYRATFAINLPRDHPGFAYVQNGGKERLLRLSDFISQREFRQTGLYWDQFKPLRLRYQLVVIPEVSGHIMGVAITRGENFRPAEEEIIRALAPHLNRAHANAQLFTSLQRQAEKTSHFSPRTLLKYGITAREAETLQWLIEGKRNLEIAIILGISPRTVEKHVQSLLAKLGCETRTAAAARAQEILFR